MCVCVCGLDWSLDAAWHSHGSLTSALSPDCCCCCCWCRCCSQTCLCYSELSIRERRPAKHGGGARGGEQQEEEQEQGPQSATAYASVPTVCLLLFITQLLAITVYFWINIYSDTTLTLYKHVVINVNFNGDFYYFSQFNVSFIMIFKKYFFLFLKKIIALTLYCFYYFIIF